jgi:hypothetical protein
MTRTDLRKGDELGCSDCAEGDADGDDPLQHRRFREIETERHFGPFDDDELQRGAGAPEQRGHRQRDLSRVCRARAA